MSQQPENLKDEKGLNRHLKIIKQNSYRQIRLINNILDMARIDSGHVKVNLTNCNVVLLIDDIVQSVAPYAEQKGLSLLFDTECEEIITAIDMCKMERIMLNLLSNAIKFTPPGGRVWIRIGRKKDTLSILVQDTGQGIPQEKQAEIFERYRQLDNPLIRQHEGSGIGLSLVKSFVELHDGTIRVESKKNNGSSFIIEIPIKLTATANPPPHRENNRDRLTEITSIELSDLHSSIM